MQKIAAAASETERRIGQNWTGVFWVSSQLFLFFFAGETSKEIEGGGAKENCLPLCLEFKPRMASLVFLCRPNWALWVTEKDTKNFKVPTFGFKSRIWVTCECAPDFFILATAWIFKPQAELLHGRCHIWHQARNRCLLFAQNGKFPPHNCACIF